jgi:hypothetical protein
MSGALPGAHACAAAFLRAPRSTLRAPPPLRSRIGRNGARGRDARGMRTLCGACSCASDPPRTAASARSRPDRTCIRALPARERAPPSPEFALPAADLPLSPRQRSLAPWRRSTYCRSCATRARRWTTPMATTTRGWHPASPCGCVRHARSVAASRRLCPCATSGRERGAAWARGAARAFACAARGGACCTCASAAPLVLMPPPMQGVDSRMPMSGAFSLDQENSGAQRGRSGARACVPHADMSRAAWPRSAAQSRAACRSSSRCPWTVSTKQQSFAFTPSRSRT